MRPWLAMSIFGQLFLPFLVLAKALFLCTVASFLRSVVIVILFLEDYVHEFNNDIVDISEDLRLKVKMKINGSI